MFFDIAGIDGCGKSTISVGISNLLQAEGLSCKVFHGYEPRHNIYMLRDLCIKAGIPYEESSKFNTLGMSAALMDLFCNTKALFSKNSFDVYIAEKYVKDSVVYMSLLGGDSEIASIYEKFLPKPDLRVILDLDPAIANMRVIKRSQTTGKLITEKENYEIMRIARTKFLSFAEEKNTIVVDASQPEEQVLLQVYSLIKLYL